MHIAYMKSKEVDWKNIYERVFEIVKKYGIFNLPHSDKEIFISYSSTNVFRKQEDYKNLEKIRKEIEDEFKKEMDEGIIVADYKFFEDGRITIKMV